MKKIIILCILPLFLGFKSDETLDDKRMNRDLEIGKNILSTLIKGVSDNFFGGNAIEASYIQGYGVIFTIPEHLVYFHSGINMTFTMPEIPEMPEIPDFDFDFDFDFDTDESMQLSDEDREDYEKEMKEFEKQMEQQKREIRIQREHIKEHVEEAKRHAEVSREEIRKNKAESDRARSSVGGQHVIGYGTNTEQINWEEIMRTFMTDYADLIGQLKPEEKIVIKQKSAGEIFRVWKGNGVEEKSSTMPEAISAEVFRKDIEAYKSGKINKDEYNKRIKIIKEQPQTKNADLEMFTSIFDRYYSRDLSETFFTIGKPRYELLDGFGAIIQVRAMSPGKEDRIYFHRPGQELTSEQKKGMENDEKLYQQFKVGVKDFLLDYGRTIRSLDGGEKLRLEISLESCRKCKVPQSFEVATDLSTLMQYDQQKISKEKALEAIEIKENY